MTLTSLTIKEYLVSQGDIKTNRITLCLPISLREPPDKPEDFELRNDFATVNVDLELVDNFDEGIKVISKKMKKMK